MNKSKLILFLEEHRKLNKKRKVGVGYKNHELVFQCDIENSFIKSLLDKIASGGFDE